MSDIKHRLEIAIAIQSTSCRKIADEWGCTPTHVWRVARDAKNSAPIREKIEEFIERAEKKYLEEILIKEAA